MKLMSYPEAAEYLGVSPITLRKMVCERRVPHLKPFGKHSRTFFLEEDLTKLLLDSRVPAGAEG